MNPIKAHLLNRLRPKDKTMETITDEEAFALGQRAMQAGMRLALGNIVLTRHHHSGIVVGFDRSDTLVMSMGATSPRAPGYVVPDLRDPGTEGHAMEQLRNRSENLNLVALYSSALCGGIGPDGWGWTDNPNCRFPTKQQLIVAAFEAIKETP